MITFGTSLFAPRHGWALAGFILLSIGIGALILGLLCSTPKRYRKSLVIFITFISGLFLSIEFFIPHENVLTKAMPTVANIEMVVGSFALMLGVWNLFEIHGKTIAKRSSGWYNSVAFFIAFFGILISGFLRMSSPVAAAFFKILLNGFLLSLQATTFSLVAFYIVSAAYRAFRIRSAEAVLMMAAAGIIMLALVPAGAWITSWLPETGFFSIFRLDKIGYWLLVSPNMAAQRAIAFGLAVGSLATGLRIWLSLERGSYFDRQL